MFFYFVIFGKFNLLNFISSDSSKLIGIEFFNFRFINNNLSSEIKAIKNI